MAKTKMRERTVVTPAKLRVEQSLSSAIRGGMFVPGQKLPSGGQLAKQHGVSPGTIHAALGELQRAGLVRCRRGDGTYVCPGRGGSLVIRLCHSSAYQIKTKQVLGKLREAALGNANRVVVEERPYIKEYRLWDPHRQAVDQFSSPEPMAMQELAATSLPWLAQSGLCEDLTSRFEQWRQKDNVYPIAMEAVKHEGRIYGLPFHATLTGLTYDRRAFEEIGQDPKTAAGSLERFVEILERFAKNSRFQSCFFGGNTRAFLMQLLRGYYPNLAERFVCPEAAAIEPEVGLEVLKLLRHIKWELGALIASPGVQGFTTWQQAYDSLQKGEIPLLSDDFNTRLAQMTTAQAGDDKSWDRHIGFQILSWGKDGKPFTMFNSYVWIINPRIEQEARDFCWLFLQDYISPESEYELDMRYLEEGMFNHRTDPFIQGGKRVPAQMHREELRKTLFECAELEIPDNVPAFDRFLTAAYRVLFDRAAEPEREYEYYYATTAQAPGLALDWVDSSLSR